MVVVTDLWQAGYKAVSIGILGSLNDFLICGIRLTHADVVSDATAKENRFLGYDAHILTQPVDIEVSNAVTIKFHLQKTSVPLIIMCSLPCHFSIGARSPLHETK